MKNFQDEFYDDFNFDHHEEASITDPKLLAELTKAVKVECAEMMNPVSDCSMLTISPFTYKDVIRYYERKMILMSKIGRWDYVCRFKLQQMLTDQYYNLLMQTEMFLN